MAHGESGVGWDISQRAWSSFAILASRANCKPPIGFHNILRQNVSFRHKVEYMCASSPCLKVLLDAYMEVYVVERAIYEAAF